MTDNDRIEAGLADRERHPLGRPRPYTPGHPDLRRDGLPQQRLPIDFMYPGWIRAGAVLLALLLAAYAAHGLAIDDLYVPGKRSYGNHYHGAGAVAMAGMLVCAGLWVLATAFGKFDPVTQQSTRRGQAAACMAAAIVFMVGGLLNIVSR